MTQDINRASASALRKRSLLGSTALAAATVVMLGASSVAYGANGDPGNQELAEGTTTVTKANAANGLLESGQTAALQTTTIDVHGSTTYTLGAIGDADSITVTASASTAKTLILNFVDGTPGTDVIVFAGDIDVDNTDLDLIINIKTAGLNAKLTANVENAGSSTTTFVLGDGTTGTNTFTIDMAQDEDLTVDAAIKAAAAGNTTTLNITNSGGGDSAVVTIEQAVGGTTDAEKIDTINVTDSSSDGNYTAKFKETVNVGAFKVTGDNSKTATAEIAGNLTASGNVTVTAGGTSAAATLTLGGAENTAAAYILDDATTLATLNVKSTAAQEVNGVIKGAGDGEGTVNAASTTANLITFNDDVGATGAKLANVNVGANSVDGNVLFKGEVIAAAINVTGITATGSKADFDGDITTTTLTITAGSTANFSAVATIAADVDGNIVLDDDTGGTATVTFDGGDDAEQTMTGTIKSGSSNIEGLVVAKNALTVKGGIGVTGSNAGVKNMQIASGKVVTVIAQANNDGVYIGTDVSGVPDSDGATTGGSLVLKGKAGATSQDNGENQVSVISGTTTLEGLTVQGGEGFKAMTTVTGGSGGTSKATLGGVTKIDTINVVGGSSAADGTVVDNTGSAGAAGVGGNATLEIDDTLTATTVNVKGGAGSSGGDANANVGSNGAQGGDALFDLDKATGTVQVIGTINLVAGAGGNGGDVAGSANAGGGGQGGNAEAKIAGDVKGNIILNDGADGTVGTKAASAGGTVGVLGAGGDAKVTFDGDGGTLTGDITVAEATDDGEGQVAFTHNYTVTGSVGTASNKLASITVTDAKTATVKGEVGAKEIVLGTGSGDATIDIAGTTAQTITGVIYGATTAGTGVITVSNVKELVTFASAIGKKFDADGDLEAAKVKTITLADKSKTLFGSTVDAAGTITVGEQAEVQFNGLVTAEVITFTNTTKTTITVGSGFTVGSSTTAASDIINVSKSSGSVVLTASAADSITVVLPSNFTSGHLVLVNSGAADITAEQLAAFTAQDTALVDYEIVDGKADTYSGTVTTQDIVITATKKSGDAVAKELGITDAQVGNAFSLANDAINSDTVKYADLVEKLSAVLADTSTAGKAVAKKAAEQIAPQADTLGAVGGATAGAGASSFGAVSQRMASLRTGDMVGIATGDHAHAHGKSFWVKGFGSTASQDEVDGVAGYKADTGGAAFGVDGAISEGAMIGATFSIASTSVDGEGAGNSQVDIDTYQVNVYGQIDTGGFFVDGTAGYGWNNAKSSRSIDAGDLDYTAKGEFDGKMLMAAVGVSAPVDMSGATFTPRASFTYTNVSYDEYSETGASALNLKDMDQDDMSNGILALGGEFQTSTDMSDGFVLTPSLRAKVFYDLIGDQAEATSTYEGGTTSFSTKGAEVDKLGGSLGVGVLASKDNVSLSANYDATLKDGFIAHAGQLRVNVGF